ncbi:MAG: hypothetical protein F7B60_03305 [Desulfurococcales archaeon]|nr:hypothetical protein [Desulfurococcales archaeon]
MNRVISVIIIMLLLFAVLPYQWGPVNAVANDAVGGQGLNMTITATLYSDGYVRVKGSIPARNGEATPSFRVLYNYTFYQDKTIKDESIFQNGTQTQATGSNEYMEVNLTGIRNNGNLTGLMNLTQIFHREGKGCTRMLMKYNVAYEQYNWTLKAHFDIHTNDTSIENSLKNITALQFLPSRDAEIVSFNHSLSNGEYFIDLTAIIPYGTTAQYTPYMSNYLSILFLISQNRTLEINNYAYISSTGIMKMKQHIVYKGGFTDHLESYIKGMKQSFQLHASASGNGTMESNEKALINTLEELASNFEVKDGTSYTQLITPNKNIITTPLIRGKGVNDPVKTLVALRNILLSLAKTGKAGFNTTQVLNQEITLKPGDQAIRKIQPNQTILGDLENIKVNPETPRNNNIIIGGTAAIIALIVIIAIYLVRKPGNP